MRFHSLFALSTAPITVAARDCALAGPAYPAPAHLSRDTALPIAISKFELLIEDKTLNLKSNDTAWAVALFSARENKILYEHFYTPPIDIGVLSVDKDSVFRIGSVSKVFSVWSFLIEVGDSHFSDPITKYIPEIANVTSNLGQGEVYDDLNNVQWNDITLGELAASAAGIPRDPTTNDLLGTLSLQNIVGLGLPMMNSSNSLKCGALGVLRSCSRQENFEYLLQQHPIFAPQQSPAYSNFAFTLLSYALESIEKKQFSESIPEGIFKPLDMANSYYNTAPKRGGVIPGGNSKSNGWDLDLGEGAPSGALYSSAADMTKAGLAILQSKLLSPSATRRWFKPVIQTGYLGSAVGAPWEIRYLTQNNQRNVEIYTKQGDIGDYHAALALSSQHEIGWVVLTGGTGPGSTASNIRDNLYNALGDLFIPMAEEQAKIEARINFNGTYIDEGTNSSVTILITDGNTSDLQVLSLITRGVEVIGPSSPFISFYGVGQAALLYPSQLKTIRKTDRGNGTYVSRLGFKASFFSEKETEKLEDPCLMAWTALGAPMYGQVSLDDWIFEMGEDGRAEVVDVRMWRLRLKRS